MAKIYLFRHQCGGAITSRAFSDPLSEAQMVAMNAEADAIFGPGWGAQVEVDLLGPDDVPQFEARTSDPSEQAEHGRAEAPLVVGSGSGFVDNSTATDLPSE